MIRYSTVNWKFDLEAFMNALQIISEADLSEHRPIGIHVTTLRNWRNGDYKTRKFPYPSMGHFIAACNWLDLDPRTFFVLEDE